MSLTSKTETPAQLAQLARTQIIPALKMVAGVSKIDLLGCGSRQLLITLDFKKFAADNISVQQIVALLKLNSLTVPGGTVDNQGFSVPVVTNHQFQSVQDLCGLVMDTSLGCSIVAEGLAETLKYELARWLSGTEVMANAWHRRVELRTQQ